MRLSLRFVFPLAVMLALVAFVATPLIDSLMFKWFSRDIDIRSKLIASSIQDGLLPMWEVGQKSKVEKLFKRMTEDERLFAIGFCDLPGRLIYKTAKFPKQVTCDERANVAQERSSVRTLPQGPLHISFIPIEDIGLRVGQLILIHDMSFAMHRSSETRRAIRYFFLCLGAVISLITVIVAQLSWKGWVRGLKSVVRGEGFFKPLGQIASPELRPIVKDLRGLVRDLESDRRMKDETRMTWSPKTLKGILNGELSGDEVLIVSNREPYIHTHIDGKIETQVPASGLVTALEPIMRACSGTWIAHGGGTADREVVDKYDRVRVPPEDPAYQIRRVWLTDEEEAGYYYGFANEGLWALCHIAHVRPIFRSDDWKQYVAVNEKFARTVVEEAKTDDPVVLVQDYHLALVPKMIRERLPKATVITFWHIPFPNSEVFGICPWREEILEGLLGSSILGFHTRFHCNNFIDSVDRFMESRIDRESSTVSYKKRLTAVNHYPISIEFPLKGRAMDKSIETCRSEIRARHNLSPDHAIGIGVDRLDYTKGILERFYAVERMLELSPSWIGRFSFIQIAAPSRSTIEEYRKFNIEVRALAERINKRFGTDQYQPIILKIDHHEPQQVYEYYRAAELCVVTSLHDGMNLVSKEFIASRDDENGVLVLSQFAGAAKELPEALIVNPYDIDQCASALLMALEMTAEEQVSRMRGMRGLIQEFNVYRWAGRMLLDAARLRKQRRLFGDARSYR
jgi:trehalose-6-phosphate synthase